MAASKKSIVTTISKERPNRRSHRPLNVRMTQNSHVVWLDKYMDGENDDEYRNSIMKLQSVINTVNTFTDVDECIDYITDIDEINSIIVSQELSQMIIPVVQQIPQVTSVYILCNNNAQQATSTKQYSKVKSTCTDVASICEDLKQVLHECDQNAVSLSFVKSIDETSKRDLDTLDPSFMYTEILKEILLTIHFQQSHIDQFLAYCREQFIDNTTQLAYVDKIEKEYRDHHPIWWYTSQSFLYSMLNRALRLMDVDLIVKMGFFLSDLHQHIAKLHAEQFCGQMHSDSFIVYRGQGLSQKDFDQLKNTQGGLLAFNNFLSTSYNRHVSLGFARRTINASDLVGVLFVTTIDSSISTTPFANVKNVSRYQREEEILFSMHSVFRIGQVKQIEGNSRLWQVNLTLTSDNDPQLHDLTKHIQEETRGSTGWFRLGKLMLKLGHFNQAEELYKILLKQTNDAGDKAQLFHHLGYAKNNQGNHAEAIKYYEKALEIQQKTLPANHPSLATSYNNIGSVYSKMGEYSKALSYFEKALEIRQKTLPANHPLLATSYNNIGSVYDSMGEYAKALSYFEKALEIYQKTLPANHPLLATSYNNIGLVYYNMGEYSKALSYFEKALEIRQKTLPANHPLLATSYNNMGGVYYNMGEHSKALSYFEDALDIWKRSLSLDHPYLKSVKQSIDFVKKLL